MNRFQSYLDGLRVTKDHLLIADARLARKDLEGAVVALSRAVRTQSASLTALASLAFKKKPARKPKAKGNGLTYEIAEARPGSGS